MDFFNKLGEKAGETFQTIKDSDTTKKAINYAEIPGLSLQIGKQEALIKKAYAEIGAAYYRSHKDIATGDEYEEQMKAIKKAFARIDKLKKEIEEKKAYDPMNDNSEDVVDSSEILARF